MTWWACTECGAPGARNLGANGYCGAHLAALHTLFDPAVFAYNGRGHQMAPADDWGAPYATLACNACAATWIGISGEQCWWCQQAHRIMIDHQTELLLQPPDIDRDDQRYKPAMTAWADRLWVGVQAELITQPQAEQTLKRVHTHET